MAHIDYWRVCSFSDKDYIDWATYVRGKGRCRAVRFLQYEGFRLAAVDRALFYGKAEQLDRVTGAYNRHYLMQDSGSPAHDTFRQIDSDTTYCTRLDLQRTMLNPRWFSQEHCDQLYESLPIAKSIVKSALVTIYSGSRTSEVFWRLYQKDTGILRLEVELKGATARRAYLTLKAGHSPDALFRHFLDKSRWPDYVKESYQAPNDQTAKMAQIEAEQSKARKLAWVASIMPKIGDLAGDHDIGAEILRYIESLYYGTLHLKGSGDPGDSENSH